jgi:CheY-like chemotaxis protein
MKLDPASQTIPLRILVVEDDAVIASLFEELLAILGHQVCACVGSEDEAVTAAETHEPDIMIVDERLGAGSGVAAMSTILARGHVPHVYVTGNGAAVRQVQPDAVVVTKPFGEAELVAGMNRAMQVAR